MMPSAGSCLNFGVSICRLIRAASARSVWGDSKTSECVTVPAVENSDVLRQRREIAGVDIAGWFLAQPELQDPNGRYARMVWWPLGPQDRCPV